QTHSHTLPCMSNKPQGLARLVPTGCGALLELQVYQPTSASLGSEGEHAWLVSGPLSEGDPVPARAAYSLSASVAKRHPEQEIPQGQVGIRPALAEAALYTPPDGSW